MPITCRWSLTTVVGQRKLFALVGQMSFGIARPFPIFWTSFCLGRTACDTVGNGGYWAGVRHISGESWALFALEPGPDRMHRANAV